MGIDRWWLWVTSPAVCMAIACSVPEDDPAKASYQHVRNATSGLWADEPGWTVREDWRKGGADAGESYVFSGRGLALAAGPHGQLAVADREGESVRVYDRRGSVVRSIGRPGEGPGEWRVPLAVSWGLVGRLWLVDFANLRYTVYDTAGTYLGEHPRPPYAFPRMARPGRFDTTGAFLDEIYLDRGEGQGTFAVVRVDAETGEVFDTTLYLPVPRPRVQGVMRRTEPGDPPNPARDYLAHLVVDLTPEAAWVADSRRLRLVRLSHEGDTLLVVETVHRDHLTLSAVEEQVIREELRRRGQSEAESPYGREIVQAIHELDDGHVLVLIEEDVGEPGRLLDVFDPSGQFLGTLDVGFPVDSESTMTSRGDTLFVVGLDEWEAKFISRLVVQRR